MEKNPVETIVIIIVTIIVFLTALSTPTTSATKATKAAKASAQDPTDTSTTLKPYIVFSQPIEIWAESVEQAQAQYLQSETNKQLVTIQRQPQNFDPRGGQTGQYYLFVGGITKSTDQ
ncbi:MAG: hypothetical protein AB1489_41975 [Acidobacteriota bacterium]